MDIKRWAASAVAVIAAGAATTALLAPNAGAGNDTSATLKNSSNQAIGKVFFKIGDTTTEVKVVLNAGQGTATVNAFHGFHIHGNPNDATCVAPFTSVGGHWNVDPDPDDDLVATHGQHTGDLPSVYINADGSVETKFVIDKITKAELIGRAVILHRDADNFGNIPTRYDPDPDQATKDTGDAGPRIACGVIG